ncbi:MAG TPA: hypothetical protein VMV31_06350 [Terriglobales bacterium]|nr:hypothetical protein [Terriglobales bacterium]
MNPTTHKKVVVRHRPLGLLPGFLDPLQLESSARWELITPEGQALVLSPEQVLTVYFVSDLEQLEELRLPAASGRGGAKLAGLWVRVRCLDRHSLEGILASDLLQLQAGVWLTPLWPGSPWHRAFLPRPGVEQVTALEVVRPPRRRRSPATQQIGLFGENLSASRPTPAREAS